MKNYRGIIYAILASVAFGLMPIFAKFSYISGSNSTTVLFYRFLIATILLYVYLSIKKINMKIKKRQFLIIFFIGFIGYTATTETLFMSYNYLSVGLSTTLHFIYPAFVCVLEYFIFKNKMSKSKLISLIFSGLGVYALVAFENQALSTLGIFLAIISGLLYGVNVICLAIKEISDIDNRVVTMYLSFGAAIGMLVYGGVTGELMFKVNVNLIISYILIAVVSTILSIIFLLKGIESIGASSTSILGTFEPIVSIIVGAILFKEAITVSLGIGTILIIISTIILALDSKGEEEVEKIEEKINEKSLEYPHL